MQHACMHSKQQIWRSSDNNITYRNNASAEIGIPLDKSIATVSQQNSQPRFFKTTLSKERSQNFKAKGIHIAIYRGSADWVP